MSNWLSFLYLQPPIPAVPSVVRLEGIDPSCVAQIENAPTMLPLILDPIATVQIHRPEAASHVDHPQI